MEPKWSLLFSQESIIIPILSHINPVHAPSYFFNFHFNNILQSTPTSFKRYLSLSFPYWNSTCISPLPVRFACTAQLILLDSVRITQHEALNCAVFSFPPLLLPTYVQISSSASFSQFPRYCCPLTSKYLPRHQFLNSPVTVTHLCPNIFLGIIFSNTLSL